MNLVVNILGFALIIIAMVGGLIIGGTGVLIDGGTINPLIVKLHNSTIIKTVTIFSGTIVLLIELIWQIQVQTLF